MVTQGHKHGFRVIQMAFRILAPLLQYCVLGQPRISKSREDHFCLDQSANVRPEPYKYLGYLFKHRETGQRQAGGQ